MNVSTREHFSVLFHSVEEATKGVASLAVLREQSSKCVRTEQVSDERVELPLESGIKICEEFVSFTEKLDLQ